MISQVQQYFLLLLRAAYISLPAFHFLSPALPSFLSLCFSLSVCQIISSWISDSSSSSSCPSNNSSPNLSLLLRSAMGSSMSAPNVAASVGSYIAVFVPVCLFRVFLFLSFFLSFFLPLSVCACLLFLFGQEMMNVLSLHQSVRICPCACARAFVCFLLYLSFFSLSLYVCASVAAGLLVSFCA